MSNIEEKITFARFKNVINIVISSIDRIDEEKISSINTFDIVKDMDSQQKSDLIKFLNMTNKEFDEKLDYLLKLSLKVLLKIKKEKNTIEVFANTALDLIEIILKGNNKLKNLIKNNGYLLPTILSHDLKELILVLTNSSSNEEIKDKYLDFYTKNNFENLKKTNEFLEKNIDKERFKIINTCFKLFMDYYQNDKDESNINSVIIPAIFNHIDYYKNICKKIIIENNEDYKTLNEMDKNNIKIIFKLEN